MKVLLVSSGSGSRGGGEIYLALLAGGLFELGCEVVVAIPSDPKMDELVDQFESQIKVIRIPLKATYERRLRGVGAILDLSQQKRLTELFNRELPDIIHLNQQVAEDGLDIILAANRSRVPWVSTIHVGLSARQLNARLGKVRDLFTHLVLNVVGGQFITVSQASHAQLKSRIQSSLAKIDVVHNGVLAPKEDVLFAARQAARSDWGVSKKDIVIGVVGRIEAQKNPLALIDYVSDLGINGGHQVVWIGDGSLRSELEDYAQRKNVSLLVDGWRNDASTRLSGLDLFVLPSKFEGLPLAVLEAMHAGVPVIASNSDGIPEAINHGLDGYLCSSRSDWKASISSLMTDHRLRAQFASVAKQKALAQFSEVSMAKSTMELYTAAINNSSL